MSGSIELKAAEKWYGDVQVIKGIDLAIQEGEFIIFVGPSGCGKSTLLRMIAGLEETSRGQVIISGEDMTSQPPAKRGLAMVFQSYALYPHMSVRDNMGFSLKTSGASKQETAKKVNHAAEILRLDAYLDRRPKDLSGGQRQRVAIGRSIVRDPTAFLFDEPLSNLDAALRVEMRHEIAKLHQRLKRTMIYVTHDQVEAMTLADRIVVLEGGYIAQVGSPKALYEKPDNLFVAQFIGSPKMNIIQGETNADQFKVSNSLSIQVPTPAAAKYLGVRPENIQLVDLEQARLSGEIDVVEYLGADLFILVNCGDAGIITCRLEGSQTVHVGEVVGLGFDENACHFFNENEQRCE